MIRCRAAGPGCSVVVLDCVLFARRFVRSRVSYVVATVCTSGMPPLCRA